MRSSDTQTNISPTLNVLTGSRQFQKKALVLKSIQLVKFSEEKYESRKQQLI